MRWFRNSGVLTLNSLSTIIIIRSSGNRWFHAKVNVKYEYMILNWGTRWNYVREH